MSIGKIVLDKKTLNIPKTLKNENNFKAILDEKRKVKEQEQSLAPLPVKDGSMGLKKIVNDMIKNHEKATHVVKTSLTKNDHSPEKLLAIQYKTGLLFLREQMFCKTAELSANTFKSFTQMQV